MSLLMYNYRLYPSGKQKVRIINSLKVCKVIYNELLETSINTYKDSGKTLRKFDYNKLIKGKYPVHSQVAQNVSDRVHKAFSNFFRRVKDKSCKRKGFPRFKSRVNSITFPQSGFKIMSDKRLHLSKIGNIPFVLHRIPKGEIKTLTIKQNRAGQWFATFACEMETPKVTYPNQDKIGIDVGLEHFATLSNGEMIENPRWLRASEHKLKRLQRIMSRRVKGSHNRAKARFKVARCHLRITNQRDDFLHKLSRNLVSRFQTIAGEQLNIKGMVTNHCVAKSIADASWDKFIKMLSYKAVTCGGQVLKNPRTRGSSHRCSNCGFYVEDMPLSKRTFKCPKCLVILHRDLNASNNHIKDTVGLSGIYTPVEIPPLPLRLAKASGIVESGTITTKPSTSSVVGSPFLKKGRMSLCL